MSVQNTDDWCNLVNVRRQRERREENRKTKHRDYGAEQKRKHYYPNKDMQYKTTYKHYRLLVKPSLDPITKEEYYTVWQCGFTKSGLSPIAARGKYPNAVQALADFKRNR